MERLDVLQLFADARELDGLAGDGLDGQSRAAPGVAVQFTEHDGINVQPLVEALGRVHRVLAGHGVHNQHDLVGLDGGLDVFQLIHQSLVHMQTAGGIQKHHVIATLTGVENGFLGSLNRILSALFKDRDAQLLAADLQLLDGGGTVDVAGHQQGVSSLPLLQACQLGAVGGFTGALQAYQHNNRWAVGIDIQVFGIAAHELNELFVDNLNDHLGRGERFQHVGADTALRHSLGEVLDHLVADIRFQQRHADLPHSLLHIGFLQAALAAKLFEGGGNFFG